MSSEVWIPVFPHEAVKGQTYMNFRIIAVAKQTHFRHKDGQCPVFPYRLLPKGTYQSILIDTKKPLS
jgi:hypothetical protein